MTNKTLREALVDSYTAFLDGDEETATELTDIALSVLVDFEMSKKAAHAFSRHFYAGSGFNNAIKAALSAAAKE